MFITKGKTRIVFVIGGYAFKIARINLIRALKRIYHTLVIGGIPVLYQELRECNHKAIGSIRYQLLRGILANLSEEEFFNEYKLKICAPTLFSFFGLINVQKAVETLSTLDAHIWWSELYIHTHGDAIKGSHTFAEPQNFGLLWGSICILDYADQNTQKILLEYGEGIRSIRVEELQKERKVR